MVEQHGEKFARLKVFENTFCACLQKAAVTSNWKSGGKRFWGSIVRTMTAKNSGGDWSVGKSAGTGGRSVHPSIHRSFIASGRCIEPDAPALCKNERWKGTLLEMAGDTHSIVVV